MGDEDKQATLTWRVTPFLMCILDRQGHFVAVNPAWQETLGWTRSEMVGEVYVKFLHPDDVARSMSAFEVVKSGSPVLRFENRYRTRTGDHRWLQWVTVPEGSDFYCTARDVTDDKQRVHTIADQRAEAELREQFMAVLSHDLRNPMAAIGAGTHLLLRRAEDEKSIEILRQMQSSVSRMSELINNLMDFTRIRLGGGIVAKRTASNIGKVLEQVIEEIRLVSPQTVIEARIDIAETVSCDAGRISQLVSNLLANAVTHGKASEPVRIVAETRGNRLKITVSNKGEPITEAVKAKLFQPFSRGEVRASKQGLGLGLYIASEIAKAHEGTLAVSSTGEETHFTLDMPRI